MPVLGLLFLGLETAGLWSFLASFGAAFFFWFVLACPVLSFVSGLVTSVMSRLSCPVRHVLFVVVEDRIYITRYITSHCTLQDTEGYLYTFTLHYSYTIYTNHERVPCRNFSLSCFCPVVGVGTLRVPARFLPGSCRATHLIGSYCSRPWAGLGNPFGLVQSMHSLLICSEACLTWDDFLLPPPLQPAGIASGIHGLSKRDRSRTKRWNGRDLNTSVST